MGVLQHVVLTPAMEPDARVLYLAGSYELTDSGTAVVPAGQVLSTGTYFNAVPAAFWARSTTVRSIDLAVEVSGPCRILLRGSEASGRIADLDAIEHHGPGPGELTATVDLSRFHEAGWCWFDVEAAPEGDVTLVHAEWRTESVPQTRATVSMTTMNKPDYAVRTLGALASRPEALEAIDLVLVVDQGSQLVREHADFPAVRDALGDRLQIVEQSNGGGSSGFSRGMIEALSRESSAGALLLDDDVVLEPESVRRAVVFASLCRRPTLVGGHMLDLNRPTRLHSWAEMVSQEHFMWGPAIPESARFPMTEIAAAPEWVQRPTRTDYNGWFMCFVPRGVIEEIGAAVPMFLKWDDAEYGLRAEAAGYPTVTLPGVALWHLSWLDKIDTVDWQAYFHTRNRLVAALLHAERPRGGRLLHDSRRQHLKQLLSMEYYAVDVRNRALRDVLHGPAHLESGSYDVLPSLRARMADYPETTVHPLDPTVAPARDRVPVAGPRGLPLIAMVAHALTRHSVLPEQLDEPIPLTADEATWWHLPFVDAADVTTPDGVGTRQLRRDRRKFLRLWWGSIRGHAMLWLRWRQLSKSYRGALPEMTAPSAWRKLIADHQVG